jgi:iron complex outermembrane receptor protein
LEEVLVTATKRGEAQNVQDVPIAVTAFGAEQLQSLNFQNLQSLTYTIPNVQLETIGTIAGYQNFSIRGLGINSSIPSIDPTVGVFVDGVYMGINAGILFDNFDVEGIEVLRGPQGILFGRNVTGGAVLLRTRTPQFEPEFAARAGVEEGLNYVADFSVTGPLISDQLAAKLAVYYNDDQGWFKNLYDGKEYGATQQWIVRPAFRWTPTEALDLVLRLEHGQRDGEGSASQNHAIFSRDSFDFVINDRGFSDDEWSHAFLEANWRVPFGDGTVTNVFGWREFEGSSLIDVDGTANTAFHGGFYTDQSQYSNELRYAGMFGPLSLTAGLYYFTQDLFYIENRTLAGGATRVIGGGTQDSSVQGVFAAGDWALTETVTLNLGARYTYEEKDAKVSLIRPGGCDLAAKTCTFTFADDQSWNDVSPRIGLQWQPTQETQVYGFWAKGFRSGGYNMRQTAAANTPGPFDAEEQSSFEVGIKQDFPVGARLNLAAFHNTIENIQREINLPGPLGVAQLITNVGELEIKGAELEAEMRLAAGLVVAAQAGYTHGKYTELDFDLNGDGVIDGLDFDLKPPRLSPWTYGASVAYQFGLGSLGSLASRISFNHRDANFYTDNNRGVLNEFDDLGANFTFRPSGDGPWSIAVYGRNLLNKTSFGGDTQLPDVAGFAGDGPAGPRPPATFSPLNKGRVIGAELRVKF